ncbi:hypothetical protein HII31_08109 [Pseudocercospora fuligena]|uniref:Uncharacterized protein n=1 Tax=Pseudocercospora fuligena TaxID=685502 RepID=A0A8H6RFL3_9PEZI|nr:hypothetical protein HII31_08109 [Pseudocercospora fuligena]
MEIDLTDILRDIEQHEAAVEQSEGCDGTSRRTKASKMATLSRYRYIAARIVQKQGAGTNTIQLGSGAPEDANDQFIFCHSQTAQLRLFLLYVRLKALSTRPRKHKPRASTVMADAGRLLSFMKTLRPASAEPLNCQNFTRRAREVVESLAKEGCFDSEPYERPALGRDDTIFMIDEDMYENPKSHSLVAFQHHLLWCLGLLTGCRPNSLIPNSDRVAEREFQGLAWKDVELRRIGTTGQLLATVKLRWLKGNRDSIVKRTSKKPITFMIRSPKDLDYLVLSVPHGLLRLALRRNLLRDHTSAMSVLQGSELVIKIKDHMLSEPVFVSNPYSNEYRGDGPLLYDQMHLYLKNAIRRCGFDPGCSFMSWRTLAGTKIERATDVSTAQKALTHQVGGSTYHKHYDRGIDHVDVTGIIVDETDDQEDFVLPQFVRRGPEEQTVESVQARKSAIRDTRIMQSLNDLTTTLPSVEERSDAAIIDYGTGINDDSIIINQTPQAMSL